MSEFGDTKFLLVLQRAFLLIFDGFILTGVPYNHLADSSTILKRVHNISSGLTGVPRSTQRTDLTILADIGATDFKYFIIIYRNFFYGYALKIFFTEYFVTAFIQGGFH